MYTVPTEEGGSNHTAKFAESARTLEAHAATLATSKCLAITALRVLIDAAVYQKVSPA